MAKFRTAPSNQSQPERAVAFVAVRFRTLIRGIAFEDKRRRRQGAECLWSPPRLGPGNAASETEGQIEAQCNSRQVKAAGKGVEDAADARSPLLLENLQAACQRATAMEKERQPGGDGDAQLRPKDDLLLRHGDRNPAIETNLADGNDRRLGQELRQSLSHRWRPGLCRQGMEAGGEEEAGVVLGQCGQIIPTGGGDAGDKERGDSLAPGSSEFVRQLIGRKAIKVNVRIKEFVHQP